MNKNLVSVIIPAYNHENYVQETIKSIIEQTYKNIELFVLDDGSKDSTFAKIQEMEDVCKKRFTHVHFETKENEGIVNTLNKMLEISKGKYVYIIASDDTAKPTAIEKQVKFLEKNPDYALAVGDNEIIDSNGKHCYWDKDRNNIYDIKKAKWKTFGEFLQKGKCFKFTSRHFGKYQTLYPRNYITNGYLIRKSIFEKAGYYSPNAPLEDWYLMLQISKYAKMKFINEPLFSYRWHGANSMNNLERIINITNITSEYEEKILENIDEKEVLPDVLKVKKYGAYYKRQGIPYIFEILTYRKNKDKIKEIRLFNFRICRKNKGEIWK